MSYYVFGDIHGCFDRLEALYRRVCRMIQEEDTLVFLGDYIDRGPSSFEVVEFLIELARTKRAVFLKGNHEDMLAGYLARSLPADTYYMNGGRSTINSYRERLRRFSVPEEHNVFFRDLRLYFETDCFIAVHAGLNPDYNDYREQPESDFLWIREAFFRSPRRWEKTVVFGHTPTLYISRRHGEVYADDAKNIVGIDTGAVYGGKLTCFRFPDRAVFQV